MTTPTESSSSELAAFTTAVTQQCARFNAAYAAGDVAGLVDGYYVERPLFIPPEGPVLDSRQAVKAALQHLRETGIQRIDLTPVHLRVAGHMGFEVGRANLTIAADGKTSSAVMRYVIVWEKHGEQWRAATDMFAPGEV
jgi:ketosteroid isomerase-like protein